MCVTGFIFKTTIKLNSPIGNEALLFNNINLEYAKKRYVEYYNLSNENIDWLLVEKI